MIVRIRTSSVARRPAKRCEIEVASCVKAWLTRPSRHVFCDVVATRVQFLLILTRLLQAGFNDPDLFHQICFTLELRNKCAVWRFRGLIKQAGVQSSK